ncbi:hypothetical protein LCGC14_1184050, partial [marine sediment metagenome]
MIQILSNDLLSSTAEAYVNPVNCEGVMGKGLALHMKKQFNLNFKFYEQACKSGELNIGTVLVSATRLERPHPKYIINFPTKSTWKKPSELVYITKGLKALEQTIERLNIKSIAIPALGCGLGGLNWNHVLPKIEETFSRLPDV